MLPKLKISFFFFFSDIISPFCALYNAIPFSEFQSYFFGTNFIIPIPKKSLSVPKFYGRVFHSSVTLGLLSLPKLRFSILPVTRFAPVPPPVKQIFFLHWFKKIEPLDTHNPRAHFFGGKSTFLIFILISFYF